jgi:ABC-type phosphate/phosphonate transport system substrate-binding protein
VIFKYIPHIPAILILLGFSIVFAQPKNEDAPFFNMAFSEKIFSNINENDAKALTKVLTENLIKNSPLSFRTSTPNIIRTIDELKESIDNESNDLYVILPTEYLQLEKNNLIEPIVVPERDNSVFDIFKLIVTKESSIKNLNDLKGKKILISTSAAQDIPHFWLDHLLSIKGLSKKEKYFKEIENSEKSLTSILKVYFGQADACIISESNLNLAIELNPQLDSDFTTLEISKPIVRAILAQRTFKTEENKKILLDNLLSLNKTTEGKQILMLFKVDKLIPYKDEFLDSSYDIVQVRK